jgi:hypothetical protein
VSAAEPLIRRLDIRAVGAGGLGVAVIGTVLLTRISVEAAYRVAIPPRPVSPLTRDRSDHRDRHLPGHLRRARDAGLASGLYTAVSYGGGARGLAVLSTIAASRTADILADTPGANLTALASGYRTAYVTVAILLGAAALLILTLLRPRDVAALQTSTPSDHDED